ncbi:autotransporter outer membrane beta-barrel domain-containing protein [Serratia proteamaculans]|uniref:autotransporter outer membrane beta-barrel domain-containing protein n=1 Tax=Serratia proteamaculans TaxID=28151 RepID=UPI001F10611D|nr:autotransporter outer membrane beta-barrel domain-containing protein [Serratia proteamaculans]
MTGEKGSAINIGDGTKNINLLISNGSQLNGGNGVALQAGKDSQSVVNVDNSSVSGNVINEGTTNISLKNHASWTGTMQNVSNMTLSSGTAWNLTGTSSITGNLVNDGTVSLAHGTTAGNVLTVNGNYTGNNGNLLFNTALGDDKSATDKLLIKGNAAGTTNVSVTNAGGSGKQTIDGIEIIHVDGASTADTFKQKGRIVAGAYDYKLMKRNNSWYLDSHSTGPGPVPPIELVVRPEAGSYIANIAAANSMFQTSLHDRLGETRYIDPLSGEEAVTSLWLRQVGNYNRFRDSTGQLSTQSNTYVSQLGGDVAQWSRTAQDRWHLGLMAGYGNNHNNTQSSVSGHHSKGSVDGYSVGLYGTWFANEADRTGAYVDSQLQYGWFNNHVNGDDIAAESYKSKGLTASLETGYTFALGESGSATNPTRYFIEPNVQVTWMGVKADDLTESNGTHVSSQGDNNIQTRVGARAFMKAHSTLDNGKDRDFQPFVEVNWLHNTKRYGATLNGVAIEQAGATNIGEMKAGVEGQLTKRMQLWGNVGQQLGDQGYSNTEATLGVKYAF